MHLIALSLISSTFIQKILSCHNRQHYFSIFHNTEGSRDNSVGIVSSCDVGYQRNQRAYSVLDQEFLSSHRAHSTGASFSWAKNGRGLRSELTALHLELMLKLYDPNVTLYCGV